VIDHDRGPTIFHELLGYIAERRRYRGRWVGALQRTDLPLRLVAGTADPICGAETIARFRELVPRAGVVELPAIGHYPQLEASEAVLAAIVEFHRRRDAHSAPAR
jgi:pimeloyl-ACP methyl ester carboxylesterase